MTKNLWNKAPLLTLVRAFSFVSTLLFLVAPPSHAQITMAPGQALPMCNTIGSTTGGGVVCKHNLHEERIDLTYMNSMWHTTFWGDGSAPSMLTQLCHYSNIKWVTEVVFEPVGLRVRTIPCDTGRSGTWELHVREKS